MLKEYAAADHVWMLRKAPAPSNEQANQVGAFSGQLAALQRAFDDYKESTFSVDKDSGRSTKKASKKKKNDDMSRRKCSRDNKTSKKQMQTLQGGLTICGQA